MEKASKILKTHVKQNFSPLSRERTLIKRHYAELKTKLQRDCFQSGSYARFTSITPVNDLDVILVIGGNEFKIDSVGNILTDLRDHLKKEYEGVASIKLQSHSVGIYFGGDDEFSIDVVPAKELYEDGRNIFLVPEILYRSKRRRSVFYSEHEGMNINWIKSDPKGYIEYAKHLNNQNDDFRDLTKLLKEWKRRQKNRDETFPLKSFHLELIVGMCIEERGYGTFIDLLKSAFQLLSDNIDHGPMFVDKAYASDSDKKFIDAYLEDIPSDILHQTQCIVHNSITALLGLSEDSNRNEVLKILSLLLLSGEGVGELISSKDYPLVLADDSHAKNIPWLREKQSEVIIKAFSYSSGREKSSREIISNHGVVFSGGDIKFIATSKGISGFSEIFWQVVNTGRHAREAGCLRGDVLTQQSEVVHWESSLYTGLHWVKCFVVKDEKCIAESDKFFVAVVNPKYI